MRISGVFSTVKEAADMLAIDQSLVARYCRQGRLDALRISRTWLIRRASLEEFSRLPRERGNPNFKKRAARNHTRKTADTANKQQQRGKKQRVAASC